MAQYRWQIIVRRWDTYGEHVLSETPMTVFAANKAEVTTKVCDAFNASFDTFRKFWSHDWLLERVDETADTEGQDND